jgi:hypothetical protein
MVPTTTVPTAVPTVNSGQPSKAGRTPALLELVALDNLPCGCVAAAYRAKPWDLAVVSIEAKGPHCPNHVHLQGRVLELGAVSDLLGEEEEE